MNHLTNSKMTKEKEKNEETKKVFMNPLTDVGFKYMFGTDEQVTMEFLNDLLDGIDTITDLEFLDKEQPRMSADGKTVIYDVYCETKDHKHIIIEMQKEQTANFKERMLYYMSRSVDSRGKIGKDWQYELNGYYGVFFMNFYLLGKEKKQFLRDVTLTEQHTNEVFYDKFRMFYLELPSFTKTEEECNCKLDYWIYTIKNMENMTTLPFKTYIKNMERLEEIMNKAALDPKKQDLYEESLKQYRDNLCAMTLLEQTMKKLDEAEDALEDSKLASAQKMKADGMPADLIQKYTGLSPEAIEGL